MYSISRFQQIIKPVMNGRFARHVRTHKADKHSKGFGCQNLLLCLLYAQLGRCASLRTLEQSFNAHSSHHYHLNMRSIRRSTLSEAPAKRDPRPFADMLIELSALCGRTLRKQAGDLLYLLDSTPIVLKGRGFDQWTTHNGRITGLKLHILMNHADQCPVAHSITDARVNDVDERHIMQPEKGATYVFDKGYCDYNWWAKLDEAGAYFVTRLKTNAAVETIQRFLGRSANAVKLQILCAMIAYLLLKLYRQSGRMGESLHLLCARIAGSLFERPQTLYAHYARRRRERLEPARMQGVLF